MNIKIRLHLMPWELDTALLTYNQLSKSINYISKEDKVILESCLNLSSNLIDWENSYLQKEFFIEKFKNLNLVLSNDLIYISKIYSGDNLYGHLDSERESLCNNIDAYMNICPDMIFDEDLISYMIEGAKKSKNKYFIITPQIPKLWDNSWDILVNDLYKNTPYGEKINSFDLINNNINKNDEEIYLDPIPNFKYAGWFDLYSKLYCEELVPIRENWNGKGGWDTYSMNVSNYFKNTKDIQQYVLKGKIIYRTSYCKNFEIYNTYSCYKNLLKLKPLINSRDSFDKNIPFYIQEQIKNLESKK